MTKNPIYQLIRVVDNTLHPTQLLIMVLVIWLNPSGWLLAQGISKRDPQRQYIFLPTAGDVSAKPIDAEQSARADQLFAQAEVASQKSFGAEAYQLLHEALVVDPNHAAARQALGYRRETQTNRWTKSSRTTTARQAKKSQSIIGWNKNSYWIVKSPHFEIHSAAGQAAGLQLAEKLERWHSVWRQVFFDYWSTPKSIQAWLDGKENQRSGWRRHQVILFRDRDHYLSDLGGVDGIQRSTGYYNDKKRASFFYHANPMPLNTWRHELVHQLFQETAGAKKQLGQNGQAWILEGIAMYFESMQEYDTYVTLGGFDAPRLQYARLRAKREGFYVPLVEFDEMTLTQLQRSDDLAKLYSQAAGISQFLMTGRDGAYRNQLIKFIQAFYQRKTKSGLLEKLTNTPLDQLDRQYQAFLDVSRDTVRNHLLATEPKALALGRCGLKSEDLAEIAKCSSLRWLELSENPLDDLALDQLKGLNLLENLFLDVTAITDDGIDSLRGLPSLSQLDLSSTRITDQAVEQLADLKNLQVLWLHGTQVSDQCLDQLLKIPNLTHVGLKQTRVTPQGIAKLNKTNPKLIVISH